MHRCPECGAICYCDFDDTDYGDEPLTGVCHHECDDFDDEDDLRPDDDTPEDDK